MVATLSGLTNATFIHADVSPEGPVNHTSLSFQGIIYFMCTGGDPDQLYKRPRQVLITDIPADYTTELRGLVADCCAYDFSTRPNAWQLYTKAKEASAQAYL